MNDNNSDFSRYLYKVSRNTTSNNRGMRVPLGKILSITALIIMSNIDIISYTWPTLIILVSSALTLIASPTFATSLRADTHSLNISGIVNMCSVYSGIRPRRLSVDWSMWLSIGEWPSRLEVFYEGRSAQPLLFWETFASKYPDSQKFQIK